MTTHRCRSHATLALVSAGALLLACSKADRPDAGDSAGSAPAAAASPAERAPQGGPITQAEVRDYRLTTDNVRAMHKAELNWIALSNPSQKVEDDGDEAGDIEKDATTTDGANQLLGELEKDPTVVAAIRKAGTTPRRVAIHSMVAAMSSIFAAAGGGDLPPDIAPENVAFAKAHMAELQQMQKEREAAMAKRKQR